MSSFYCKTACKTEPTTLLSHRDITISKISDGSTVYYSARLTGEVGNIDYLVTMQRSARQTLCPSIREDVTSTCTSRSNVAADQPSSHPKQKLIKVKQPRKNCALATEKNVVAALLWWRKDWEARCSLSFKSTWHIYITLFIQFTLRNLWEISIWFTNVAANYAISDCGLPS